MDINWSQECYLQAYRFSAEAHQGQIFPGTNLPYLLHISYVSMEVIAALNYEKDRDGNFAVQCDLLHDVIEDTYVSYDEVADAFGKKMADRISNLAIPPNNWNREKIALYRDDAVKIHHTLSKASDYLSRRLEKKIAEYEKYL